MSSPTHPNQTSSSAGVLDGGGLLGWARRAVTELSTRRAEINALNVFPVPDADTGSNMAHTMEAALAEAEKLGEDASVARIAEALAVGSVRGARGNSGVVLSQVLRAVAQAAADGVVDAAAIREALTIARFLVDRAISDPVEGTVVTVLRSAAIAAEETENSEADDLLTVTARAVSAARIALAKTPSQLEVLREAGVVDAGGQGLLILLESLQAQLTGQDDITEPVSPDQVPANDASHGRAGDLEVMFYIACENSSDLDDLEQHLAGLGDSLLIARESDDRGTVHIHSRRAGDVIQLAFAAGQVSDLRLEILPEEDTPAVGAPSRIVVAVTPPGTLADLYQGAGVVVVTRDPQELAPGKFSEVFVSRIVAAARRSRADEVILLPNGLLTKRELVSIERSSHAFDQAMTILPTATLVSGIAAVSVHDPAQPLGVDAYAMAEAAGAMRTAVLRVAPRAALTKAGACSKGDILAFTGPEILLIADDLTEALSKTCLRLLDGSGEQVTLLLSADQAENFNEESLRDGLGTHTDVDITVYPASGMENLVEIGVE